jgi:hypothetical protein
MSAGYADVDDGNLVGRGGVVHAWLLTRRQPCSSAAASAAEAGQSVAVATGCLIEEFALRFLGLAAFDRQHVLLGGDGDLVGRKAG